MPERIEGVNFWAKGFRICPDCGGDKFLKGPQGGNCINFKCANPDCGSEFNNMSVFGFERISEPQPNKPINREMEDNAMQVIEKDGHRRDIELFEERKVRKLLKEDVDVKEIRVFNLKRGMKVRILGIEYKVITVRPNGKVVLKPLGTK